MNVSSAHVAASNLDRISSSNRNKSANGAKDYSSSSSKMDTTTQQPVYQQQPAVYQQQPAVYQQQPAVYQQRPATAFGKTEQGPLQAPISQGATQQNQAFGGK